MDKVTDKQLKKSFDHYDVIWTLDEVCYFYRDYPDQQQLLRVYADWLQQRKGKY